jgi:hypothetical protein
MIVVGPAGRVSAPPEPVIAGVVKARFVNEPLAVPEKAGLPIVGLVKVLLVRVSVVARPTSVSVEVGRVRVPVLLMLDITGEVNVLFVNVSVVALPTNVSVVDGNVNGLPAFVNTGELTVGAVNVLFVSV